MKKILLILILINTYLFSNSSVLIINSYHKGYEWSDSVVKGIEQSLYTHSNIDTNILYMDSKRVTSKEYYSNLKKLYTVQLKNRKYDLIIAVDRFAYDFVLDSYSTFFKDEHILAVGLENFSYEKAKKYGLEKKVSALLEKRDLKSNVQLVEKLIPKIKKLYIVNDKSLNALHTEPLIEELISDFKNDYELVYLKANNLKELELKFSKYEENTAILFIRFYKNSNGKLNKNQHISSFIKNSKVPVFITDSIFVNKGATGGKIVDLNKFGRTSGEMVLNILENKKSTVLTSEDLYYVFDAQKISNFLLPVGVLNDSYTLVNKRVTFYDEHRAFINFVFTISPFLLFLIMGLIHNIYKRKKVEKELRLRLEFDRTLLDTIESPIFWQDEQGRIIEYNKEFLKLVCCDNTDIYGKKLEECVCSNANRIKELLSENVFNKDSNVIYKYIDDKEEKHIYLVKHAVYRDEKYKTSGLVTIFIDITKEKQIEKERERNQEFIVQQSKLAEIGEIFSSIAHQWKSPLVEITTIAQESFYACGACSDNEKESYVKDIMIQVDYMNSTINEFQEFIMPSNKKQYFDIHESIKSILEIVNHNIKYNYLKINIDVKEGTLLEVYGYRNEFMQSFLNIINNAKDELIKKDLKNRKIDIEIYNKNKNLIIEIKDNAGGITMDNLNKVFKPYFSTKQDGHGIGLYMTKMIIEDKMNGKISVSNINDGACFKIELGLNK